MTDNSAPDDELATWQAMHDAAAPWVEELHRVTDAAAPWVEELQRVTDAFAPWVEELQRAGQTLARSRPIRMCHSLSTVRVRQFEHQLMLSLLFAGDHRASSTAPALCTRVAAALDRLTAPGRPPGSDQRSEHSPNCRKRRAAITGCAAAVAPPTTHSVERLLSTG